MPRRARLMIADMPQHIMQRSHNNSLCFFSESDYRFYLDTLEDLSKKENVKIHAYALLRDQVHILATPKQADGISRLMKLQSQCYVQYVNKTYQRRGTLWKGRFRSCVVDPEHYLIKSQLYIEQNPVRLGLANEPKDYMWSSCRANVGQLADPFLQPHSSYLALGNTVGECQEYYRYMLNQVLSDVDVERVSKAVGGGFCLGDKAFQKEIEQRLKGIALSA